MSRIICILALFTYTQFTWGQTLHFEPAFTNHEIHQIPISFLQDSQGFMWIGTTDGVYRYDGKEVKEFRHDPTDSTSISNNFILSLHEDHQGHIWIGTRFGLNRYDTRSETIKQYLTTGGDQQSNENYIHSIFEDHKKRIWYGTYNGLFQLNPANEERLQFLPDIEQEQRLSNKLVWSVFEDSRQRIWVCTHKGFTVFKNDDTYKFQPFYGDWSKSSGLSTDRIFEIIEQPDSSIWLSSYDGIFKVIEHRDSFEFQRIHYSKNDLNSLSDDRIFAFISGGKDKIWAGTHAGGLNEIRLPKTPNETFQIRHHRHNPKNKSSISLDKVEALLTDQSGLLWVGTGKRIDKVSENAFKFQSLKANPDIPTSLSNNIIKSIFKDSFGNLWVGTYSGLNFLSAENFNNKKFEFEQFKNIPADPHSISHNNINGISEDSRGYLWISTFHGLNYIHIPTFLKDKRFNYFTDKHGIPHTINKKVTEIETGLYWLTCNGGLAKMSFNPNQPEALNFETFKQDEKTTGAIVNSNTSQVIQDKFGHYWIGTFNGVSKCIEKDDGNLFFENYLAEANDPQSLSDNSFRCFFKDRKNRLWIGTRSGLNLIQQKSKNERATFKRFGMKNGLPNDVIHAIEEDQKGQLWISTNKGLVVFNPDLDQPVIKIYDHKDGLNASTFVFNASFKDDNDILYFGTAAGLNYFNPAELPSNTFIPPIRFTKLKVLNKEVKPQNNAQAILKQSISYTKAITLKHWQNIISLEFAALDFNKPDKNQYQYKLNSLNEDWVPLGNINTVTFTNLAPGKHILEVKGSNNDLLWNETPVSLTIKVLPPLWKTWWAYLLYFLFFAGAIFSFIRFRIQQNLNKIKVVAKLEKARAEERALLRKKNAADFHDELGHRLTKISLFLELAERESLLNHSIKKYLAKIKSNTAGLSEGVRDLIWSLDPKKDSMYQTFLRLQEFGDNIFEFSTIHFKTKPLDKILENRELAPDVRKNILMLFKEAMNNSLKYSEAQNASLTTKFDDQFIYLIFQDDGKGFDPHKIKNGYGLKNMQSRADKIEGNLVIHSLAGKGTEITLRLAF